MRWYRVGGIVGLTAAVMSAVIAPPLAATAAPGASASTATSPAWLTEVNRYRLGAGLTAVTENDDWVQGLQHHLTYLERTPSSFRTGQYASAHTENPSSPYYTADGAQEGARSDLATGVAETDLQAIDGWLTSPFHAIGILRPGLQQVAFANGGSAGAGLDIVSGLDYSPSTTPILFPGPGMTTDLTVYSGHELPDPTESCRFPASTTVGLPIIAVLPEAPDADLQARLTGSDGSTFSSANGSLCVVDEQTYTSSDPVYGPTGESILQGEHAVLLLPNRRLMRATYSVAITQPSTTTAWSFSVDDGTVAPHSAPAVPHVVKTVKVKAAVRSVNVRWSGATTSGPRISSYLVRVTKGGKLVTSTTVSATKRAVTVGRLKPGTRYAVTVTARSSAGSSKPSKAVSARTKRAH